MKKPTKKQILKKATLMPLVPTGAIYRFKFGGVINISEPLAKNLTRDNLISLLSNKVNDWADKLIQGLSDRESWNRIDEF